jgi:hypothetical protein
MATVKMTFTLDAETVSRLRRTADRLAKPLSQVIREAIFDLSERAGRLSERERLTLLKAFDEFVPQIPARPATEVKKEIRQIRKARRGGGRRSKTE